MLVIQKHTGRVLGRCDIHEPFGRGFLRVYMTENAMTCIKFRYGLTPKGVKPFIIAHGFRDASMLPGFQQAIDTDKAHAHFRRMDIKRGIGCQSTPENQAK